MTNEKKPTGEKKSLSEADVVVSRSKRGGSISTVGTTAPHTTAVGATKVLDPGAKHGGGSDPDA